MKVFLIYDVAGVHASLHHRIALTLPANWLTQSVNKLLEAFIGNYNEKFPTDPLDDEEMVLQIKDEKVLKIDDTPESVLEDKAEVRIIPRPAEKKPGTGASGKPRCKNYGCQCEFNDKDNHDAACRHHTRAPIFHDTRLWWQCCDGQKAAPPLAAHSISHSSAAFAHSMSQLTFQVYIDL